MPLIQSIQTVGVGAVIPNLLTGSIYEYLPYNALVEISLVGGNISEVVATVISGSDVLMEESRISQANRFPVYPDDFGLADYAAAGDRLVLRIRNPGAAADTLRWSVKVTPV